MSTNDFGGILIIMLSLSCSGLVLGYHLPKGRPSATGWLLGSDSSRKALCHVWKNDEMFLLFFKTKLSAILCYIILKEHLTLYYMIPPFPPPHLKRNLCPVHDKKPTKCTNLFLIYCNKYLRNKFMHFLI
jgi:hypothetical protein